MAPRRKVSDAQLEILLSTMEENRQLVTGLVGSSAQGRQTLEQLWDVLVTKLNCVAMGDTKTKLKWRTYWNELKYTVRRKATKLRVQCTGTGGGPSLTPPLTPVEERIFAIIGGERAVFGVGEVRIPFDIISPMDTTQATSGEPTVEAEAQSEVPLTEPSQPERDVIDEPQAAAEEIMDVTAACAAAENRRSITRPQQRRESSQGLPRWAMELEERRLETEGVLAAAVRSIDASLQTMAQQINITNILLARVLGVGINEEN